MSKLPDANPTLTAYLVRQRRQAERQANSSAFNRSGTSVTAEGVTEVDGELDVVGSLNVTGPASFSGDTTIGGNAAITGTLSLPAGIINNAALTSPVVPQSVNNATTSFGLSTTETTLLTTTVTVPAGFTSAVVMMTSRAYAGNPNTTGGSNGAGGDFFAAKTFINGITGVGFWEVVLGANGTGVSVAPHSEILSELTPGSTFSIDVRAHTAYLAWASSATNTATIDGTIIWLR